MKKLPRPRPSRSQHRARTSVSTTLLLVLPLLLSLATGCSREAKKERHLKRAQESVARQELDKAEIELLNVLRIENTNAAAIQQLGIIYHDQGRLPRAYVALQQGNKLAPGNLAVRLRLGFAELAVRNFPAAREHALFVLSKEPGNAEAIYLLTDTATKPEELQQVRGQLQALAAPGDGKAAVTVALGTLLHREQKHAEAIATLQQAITLNPKSDAAYVALGNAYWAQTNLTQAEAAFKKAAELAPVRSPRRLRYVEFKLRTGDQQAAKEAMLALTKAAPDYVPPWIGLADLAYGAKQYDEAIELTKRVLTKDSLTFEALLIHGRAFLGKNDSAKAIVAFEQACGLFPKAAQLRYELARAHLANRDTSKAVANLTETLRLDPGYSDASLLLAELQLRSGELNPAITVLSRLVEQNPQVGPAYLLLGLAQRARGNPQEAFRAYQQMARIFPRDPQPLFFQATILIQQGRANEARPLLDQCLSLQPDFVPALEQVVALDLAAKQAASALARIQARIQTTPQLAPLYSLLGMIQADQKQVDQAEAAFLKAIELDPKDRVPYLRLARLYVDAGRQKEALAKLDLLLKTNPKDQAALLQLATIQQTAGDMAAARTAYERLLAITPQSAPILNNVAYISAQYFNELDKSAEMAARARELAPNDPNVADTFGWILYRKGDYPRAVSLLQESASRAPDNPEVFYHLAMAHYMMGDEGQALANLQTATRLGKPFPDEADARKRLALLERDASASDAQLAAELEAFRAQNPTDPVVLSRLGAYHERHGAPDKAAGYYGQVLNSNPRNLTALLGLARLNAGPLKNPSKGMELAKAARDIAPEDPRVGLVLGRLAYDSGDHKWAVSLLQESSRRAPDDPTALTDFALALFANGRIQEAETNLRTALAKSSEFPRSSEARLLSEMIALYLDPAKATADPAKVRSTLAAQPDYLPALAVDARIKETRKEIPAAIAAYEALTQRFPAFSPAQRNLALLLAASGSDATKAYSIALKARESFPNDSDLSRALGLLCYQRQDFPRAISLLTERVTAVKSDTEAWLYLGLAQAKARQPSAARTSLQKVVQSDASPDQKQQAQLALAELK